MPKVSIIVPVYNVERYLRECLNSLINQTLQDIEIICINDGSTDNSLSILEEYALRDNRVKVINKTNTGYGHSMNVGIEEAAGDYIGIVESDDFAAEEMFENLYILAYKNSAEVVKSNFIEYKTSPVMQKQYKEILKDCRYNFIFAPVSESSVFFMQTHSIWSGIYNRDFLRKNRIRFNETAGASYQDTSFAFKVWACAERVLLIKDAFLHYRTDNANSSVNSPAKVFCVCDEYNEIQRFLTQNSILQERYQYLVEALKFRTYQWNYKRLAHQFKYEFLLRTADEFRTAKCKGLLKQEYWSDEDWQAVHELMEKTEQFHYKKIVARQKADLYTQGFLLALSGKQIIIYGAGAVGKSIAKYIKNKAMTVTCFAVSSLDGNVSEIDSVPVYRICDLEKYKDTGVVLVSTKETDQLEIIEVLHQKGFSHMIAMDSELRDCIFSNL